MANQDDFVKTALRLPRSLREEIKSAAETAGHSMNAEIIARLQAGPEVAAATAILAKINEYDNALRDATKKQGDVLWRVIDRTELVCAQAERALDAAGNIEGAVAARKEIAFLRELIEMSRLHR